MMVFGFFTSGMMYWGERGKFTKMKLLNLQLWQKMTGLNSMHSLIRN